MHSQSARRSHFPAVHFYPLVTALIIFAVAVILLRFGGYLLVAPDPLPPHAQVAVVLGGSARGEEARRVQALKLLRQSSVDQVMFHVGRVWYWGEWVPDMARRYIRSEYGSEIAPRVAVCEMNVNSTEEEAFGFRQCLEEHGWRSVVIVTSNYHTRRVRLVWRQTLASADPPFTFRVVGVPDGDFEANGWWRKKLYARTWFLEFTKLMWTYVQRAAHS